MPDADEMPAALRDELLRSLTKPQREAVRAWLEDENDYTSELASFAWERAWMTRDA